MIPDYAFDPQWTALVRRTIKRISHDVETDRDENRCRGYTGIPASRPSMQRSIHPLLLPGEKTALNKELIRSIAEEYTSWHQRLETAPAVQRQLDRVRYGFFPEKPLKAYRSISPENVAQKLERLRMKVLEDRESREAHRIYMGALGLLDIVRLSFPRADSEEFAQELFKVIQPVFEKLQWEIEDRRRKDSKRLELLVAVVGFIDQFWTESDLQGPLQENIFRAAYRIGVLLGFESPIGGRDRIRAYWAAEGKEREGAVRQALIDIPTYSDIMDRFYSGTRRALFQSLGKPSKEKATSRKRELKFQHPFFVRRDWYDKS